MVNKENSAFNNTRKGWLRSFLFGKKSNYSRQPRNKAEISKNIGQCPGKIYPMERRGCGFHLYFCVDNIRKSDILKKKQTRQIKYEKHKVDDRFKCAELDQTSSSSSIKKTTSLLTTSPTSNTKHFKTVTSPGNQPPIEVQSPRGLPVGIVKNGRDHEKQNLGKQEDQQRPPNRRSIMRIKNTSSNTSLTLKDVSQNEVYLRGQMIRFSSTERHIDPAEREEIKTAKGQKIPDHALKKFGSDDTFKENESPLRFANRRKSSIKSRGTFVRNSLISIRKAKDTGGSFLDEQMITQILAKLHNIEDKISDMEKTGESKDGKIKNIVGITCNNPKSAVSVGHEENETGMRNSPTASCSKAKETVVIKFCGDEVTVNTSERSSVTKENRNRPGNDQLVYHNTQELDAHRIASGPPSKLSNNTLGGNPSQSLRANSQTTGPTEKQAPQIWRRVSEELKL